MTSLFINSHCAIARLTFKLCTTTKLKHPNTSTSTKSQHKTPSTSSKLSFSTAESTPNISRSLQKTFQYSPQISFPITIKAIHRNISQATATWLLIIPSLLSLAIHPTHQHHTPLIHLLLHPFPPDVSGIIPIYRYLGAPFTTKRNSNHLAVLI